MKRTHSKVAADLTILPDCLKDGQKVLKSTLEGTHRLHVLSVVDISKPASKPIDEIEEPEEEDKALQSKLNKGNARMFQLQLADLDKNQIRALEDEVVGLLSSVKKNTVITIRGPADVRCGNIMLKARNVANVEEIDSDDIAQLEQVKRQDIEIAPTKVEQLVVRPEDIQNLKNIPLVDLDGDFDDDDDCVILE